MNKQVDYYIVHAFNQQSFVEIVNYYLSDGYQCQGGVTSHNGEFCQAMVKYETHNPGNRGPG